MNNNLNLTIQNGTRLYTPSVLENVVWETERKGMPGKLTFSLLTDSALKIEEGNVVNLGVNGKSVFHGFLFRRKGNQSARMEFTAYDQIRYLKNKDTYNFSKSTAAAIIKMIGADYGFSVGNIEETGYIIPARVEENSTLHDMIQTVLDITLTNTKRLYVLYDEAGKLTLKNVANMKVGLLIDSETAETFDYTSTIDDDTYNRVKLVYEDEKGGNRQIFVAQDKATQKKWGTLQYYEEIKDTVNAQAKAEALLSLYNTKTRNLKISGVFGDLRVRAGSMVMIRLTAGDDTINQWMVVEKCKHTFTTNAHTMDLTLRGGEYIA